MLKRIGLVAAALVILAAFALILLGELSGEVVVLHTREADGTVHRARLWVVQHERALWVRAGARAVRSETSWYARLQREPVVELERAGTRNRYRAVPAPEARAAINSLMREGYGLPDRLIGFVREPSSSVPVRLDSTSGRR